MKFLGKAIWFLVKLYKNLTVTKGVTLCSISSTTIPSLLGDILYLFLNLILKFSFCKNNSQSNSNFCKWSFFISDGNDYLVKIGVFLYGIKLSGSSDLLHRTKLSIFPILLFDLFLLLPISIDKWEGYAICCG